MPVSTLWTRPARVLVDRAAPDLPGLWSLLYAAQRGALRLALDTRADGDLSLTLAAMDLGEALEELEWNHPDLAGGAVALDLGPIPVGATDDCLCAVGELLAGALTRSAGVLRDPSNDLATGDVLCLARVVHLLSSALGRLGNRRT